MIGCVIFLIVSYINVSMTDYLPFLYMDNCLCTYMYLYLPEPPGRDEPDWDHTSVEQAPQSQHLSQQQLFVTQHGVCKVKPSARWARQKYAEDMQWLLTCSKYTRASDTGFSLGGYSLKREFMETWRRRHVLVWHIIVLSWLCYFQSTTQ